MSNKNTKANLLALCWALVPLSGNANIVPPDQQWVLEASGGVTRSDPELNLPSGNLFTAAVMLMRTPQDIINRDTSPSPRVLNAMGSVDEAREAAFRRLEIRAQEANGASAAQSLAAQPAMLEVNGVNNELVWEVDPSADNFLEIFNRSDLSVAAFDLWQLSGSMVGDPIGTFAPVGFVLELRSEMNAFEGTPPVPPPLENFDTATLTLSFRDGSVFAFVEADITSLSVNVIPIPGAVWLFGSALGLLGWLKRNTHCSPVGGRRDRSQCVFRPWVFAMKVRSS
ncbi:MAG: hypothetical protein QNJ73_08925 [Gammaproteobacteria bacterium]|nr:hypothetical protein [Gammaproteobacteria bacterium]